MTDYDHLVLQTKKECSTSEVLRTGLKITREHTEIDVAPCAFAVVPSAKFV